MRMKSHLRQRLAVVVTLGLLVASCSTDVTESEEYLELQSELESQAAEIQTLGDDLQTSHARETDLTSTLESLRDEVRDLTAELDETSTRAAQAESDLADYINRPWPEALKGLFVVGCTDGPNEGLTDEQESALCSCMVDELEQTVSLDDFMVFSALAFASEGSTDINPITGFPTAIDDELAGTILDAGTACALSLDGRLRLFVG